jgi:hypothetical protein
VCPAFVAPSEATVRTSAREEKAAPGSLPSLAVTASTTTVEIDTALLERLRERAPGKSDRELLEDIATITLGFETIARAQERNAGADDDEVLTEAVRAVHEVRDEMAQRRAG